MTQSLSGIRSLKKFPMSIGRQREQLQKQLDDIERGIEDVQKSNGEQFTVKQLMKTRKAIEAKLKKPQRYQTKGQCD